MTGGLLKNWPVFVILIGIVVFFIYININARKK